MPVWTQHEGLDGEWVALIFSSSCQPTQPSIARNRMASSATVNLVKAFYQPQRLQQHAANWRHCHAPRPGHTAAIAAVSGAAMSGQAFESLSAAATQQESGSIGMLMPFASGACSSMACCRWNRYLDVCVYLFT